MTELEDAIALERAGSGAGGGASGAGSGGDDAATAERKRKDRERKARSRAGAKGGTEKAPRTVAQAQVAQQLDPRVIRAVQVCLRSMTAEITPEFEKEVEQALGGAIEYEIEVRLPLVSDEYAPEIGLGCAVVGAGVTRFRSRRKKQKDAKAGVTGAIETPEPPADPVAPESSAPASATAPVPDADPDDPFAAIGLSDKQEPLT